MVSREQVGEGELPPAMLIDGRVLERFQLIWSQDIHSVVGSQGLGQVMGEMSGSGCGEGGHGEQDHR